MPVSPPSSPPLLSATSSTSNNGTSSPTPLHPHMLQHPLTHMPLRSAMKSSSSGPRSRPSTPSPMPGSIPGSPRPGHSDLNGGAGSGLSIGSPSPGINPGYTPKVSFDTFEKASDEGMFSYTLQVKTEGYARTGNTRIFLCAASNDESGNACLEWVLESLVQEDDQLVVLRGFDSEVLETQQASIRQEAHDLLMLVQSRNTSIDPNRQLSFIIEFVAGKITSSIERLIALYRPDSLIVGARGQSGMMRNFGAAFQLTNKVGSVSKWCLSHSPVPVIVVRPERKIKKYMDKRKADPKRGTMFEDSKSPP